MPDRDFVADDKTELYYISVDMDFGIGWESGIFRNKGRESAHVIEILTASTFSYVEINIKNIDVTIDTTLKE